MNLIYRRPHSGSLKVGGGVSSINHTDEDSRKIYNMYLNLNLGVKLLQESYLGTDEFNLIYCGFKFIDN